MKLEDMSPPLRAAAIAALARDLDARARPRTTRPDRSATAVRSRAARSSPVESPSPIADSPRYRCHTCGAGFEQWAPAERHADTHHGARISMLGLA